MGCLGAILFLFLWDLLGRRSTVDATMKLAGCDDLGEIDVAGHVCPWQYGAHSRAAVTTPVVVYCLLDNGMRRHSDIAGFVRFMFPQGGYRVEHRDRRTTWLLFGPNCSSSRTVTISTYSPRGRWAPKEWVAENAKNDLLLTPDEMLVQYQGTIGNGRFAVEMNAPALFLAGVFNGPDANHEKKDGVSHRAAVPNPLAVAPASPYRGNAGAALDIRRAIYMRRSRLPPTRAQPVAILEQRFYAHRARPAVMVMEMEVFVDSMDPISVTLVPGQVPTTVACTRDADSGDNCLDTKCCMNPESQCYEKNPFWALCMANCTPGVHHDEPEQFQDPWSCDIPTNEFEFSDFVARTSQAEIKVGGRPMHATLWTGRTKVAEEGMNTVEVTMAYPSVLASNWTLTMWPGMPAATAAVFRSSLEPGYSPQAAADELEATLNELLEDLTAQGGLRNGTVRRSHEEAWAELWQSGFEVTGRPDVARAVNTSLYYLLSSLREDTPYSLSPGGLASNGYNGHTFWDAETWMYPPLLAWHPPLARSMLKYREDRLVGAYAKARSYSPPWSGAMFAWESAASGHETCPNWAPMGQLEHHISADIVIAARQYFYMTGDTRWLKESCYTLVAGVADFYTSRVTVDDAGKYHIYKVIPPDEYPEKGVNDSIYTNFAAKQALEFAVEASHIVGKDPNPQWTEIADNLVLLFNESGQMHPEYDGYAWGQKVKQADVVLLPMALGMTMDKQVQINDLEYYAKLTDLAGPAMTWGVHATGYLKAGELAKASENFDRAFANVRWPFNVWSETPTGGATNFITGAGGFLQSVIFGYSGVTIDRQSLRVRPTLMQGASAAKVRGLHYHGSTISIDVGSMYTTVTTEDGPPLLIKNVEGLVMNLSEPVQLPKGQDFEVMAPSYQDFLRGAESGDSSSSSRWLWIALAVLGVALVAFVCWRCMKSVASASSDGEEDSASSDEDN